MEKEIVDLSDIKVLVDSFYGKVRQDALLAPIFDEVIQDRWPQHLETMYTFWQTLLLGGTRTYKGNPFAPHANLFISKIHFDRWLELWNKTLTDNFEGEVSDEARWRASRIAEMFQMRIAMLQEGIS